MIKEIKIPVMIDESTEDDYVYDAGLMFEHNTTKLVFKLDTAFVNDDYKYYLDFATPSGIVRTDYLVPDPGGAVSFLLPAAITSQMSVICCLNIIKVNEITYKTEMVIKPKLVRLSFSTVEGDSKELAESYDFSINAMLEAIKNGDFKGEKGDKGDTGAKGEKGDKGDAGTVIADSQLNAESSNPVENKAITAALDKKVDKANGMGLSSNDFTDEYKLRVDSAEKTSNKITEFTETQTDEQYPSAKLVYDNFIAAKDYTDNGLAQKVDKVSGKMLSTNDFTNSLKQKLNGIEIGANKTITDSALSSTSANPVENKAIKAELDKKLNLSGGTMSGNLAMGGKDILNVKKIIFLSQNGEWLNMSNHPITNLATPTADHHAATKAYVDKATDGKQTEIRAVIDSNSAGNTRIYISQDNEGNPFAFNNLELAAQLIVDPNAISGNVATLDIRTDTAKRHLAYARNISKSNIFAVGLQSNFIGNITFNSGIYQTGTNADGIIGTSGFPISVISTTVAKPITDIEIFLLDGTTKVPLLEGSYLIIRGINDETYIH